MRSRRWSRTLSSSAPDQRLWRPDLLAVLDWEAVYEGTEARYSDEPLATWWVQASPGVNYYRAELPARHLPGKTVRFDNGDLRETSDGDHWFPRQEGGTAVWMFPGNVTKWTLMAEQKTQGLRVLVEVDDNYTCAPPMHQISSWLVRRDTSGNDGASYEAHVKIVTSAACDGVIVSTPKLAEVYSRLHGTVHVCPNSVDPADWPEVPEHQPDGLLRVGWAGSASHAYDLADARRALDWASRQKDVEVVVIGQLDPGVKHRRIGWTDTVADYRASVQAIDVMLCPLRPGPWSDAKSDVKALEASMSGACSVVSRTEPYRPWWDGDAPGYVADSPKAFLKVVRHLIAHRDEVRETARLAREYATTVRHIGRSIDCWREAISYSPIGS